MKMTTINCAGMVAEYLKANGYDGLVEPDGECGCGIDDLMPCGGDYAMRCEAGYKVSCTCGEGCDFHIATGEKEERRNDNRDR